jgi:hypothetical protein
MTSHVGPNVKDDVARLAQTVKGADCCGFPDALKVYGTVDQFSQIEFVNYAGNCTDNRILTIRLNIQFIEVV